MRAFAFTLFTGSFLLFGIEPLIAKFALPWFGGSPAVWTSCMLFFQAALLAGYAYAHGSVTLLAPRRQGQLQLALLALVAVVLIARGVLGESPVTPSASWRPEGGELLTLRLLGMLTVTIGLPFFLLSTTAPLLQSWFSRAYPGVSPFRLYALSNAASLLSLLSYPLLVEPLLSRRAQAWAWSIGFVLYAVGLVVCARVTRRADAAVVPVEATPVVTDEAEAAPADARRAFQWLALSTCASVLLLGTTNQLSQEVAAGPFLWVLPLAIYLSTFILCFERESFYPRAPIFVLLGVSIAGVIRVIYFPHTALWIQIAAFSGALFAGCMVCHGELYKRRPSPKHLSGFYLWVSVGGALGGLFVNVVAPRLFRTYLEYPLALGGACATAALVLAAGDWERWRRGVALGGALALTLMAGLLGFALRDAAVATRDTMRNFFGVLRVKELSPTVPADHKFLLLYGATLHGFQHADAALRREPVAYFGRVTGLGLTFERLHALKRAAGATGLNIGGLGMGIGTAAALAEAGDTLRFYEINPAVISLAQGADGYFHYLADSAAKIDVIEGDARLSLERELIAGSHRYDLVVADTFSGDAIPVHLLTEEAVAVYLEHLAPDGVLAVHISNRYLNLVPVLRSHAQRFGLTAARISTPPGGDILPNTWVVMARDPRFFDGEPFLRESARVERLTTGAGARVAWTDDTSSLLDVFESR